MRDESGRRAATPAHTENMSSSSDDEPQAQVPVMTVVHARSGADFEAGRGGRARGEHMEGVDVVDPRLPDNSRAGSSGGGAGRSSGGGQQLLNFGQQQPAVAPAAAGQGKQADKKRQLWNRRRPGRSRSGDTSLVTDIKVV